MKVVIWICILTFAPFLFACDQGAADLKRHNPCEKTNTNKECIEWSVYYTCEVRRPIFFNDVTAAICKDEADCRAVCDKIRSGQ